MFHLPCQQTTLATFVLLFITIVSAQFCPPATAYSPRNKLTWPFRPESIWNLPLGANAVYQPANLPPGPLKADPNYLFLNPTLPVVPWYKNNDAWTGNSRCDAQGEVLVSTPYPAGYIIPGANATFMPNNVAGAILADGDTIAQLEPATKCSADANNTAFNRYNDSKLSELGDTGSHSGSLMSAIGGTLRAGELTGSSGPIRHALKIEVYPRTVLYNNPSFRWPAQRSDCDVLSTTLCQDYLGTTAGVTMGSLLALPPSFDLTTVATEPAKRLAQAFKTYGAYIVDTVTQPAYSIAVEMGPGRDFLACFLESWGYPFDIADQTHPFAKDMQLIFAAMNFIDSWDATSYQRVSASNGSEGAGGGAPVVPWAPALGVPNLTPPADSIPPSTPVQPTTTSQETTTSTETTSAAPTPTPEPSSSSPVPSTTLPDTLAAKKKKGMSGTTKIIVIVIAILVVILIGVAIFCGYKYYKSRNGGSYSSSYSASAYPPPRMNQHPKPTQRTDVEYDLNELYSRYQVPRP